ncbi:hypothetical protein BC830DRAFT_894920 [Chytriomyces sp. MP71]|nr:hypothetical protein BC830DRAFT_894920 [Chytriomyces sp. MP71]
MSPPSCTYAGKPTKSSQALENTPDLRDMFCSLSTPAVSSSSLASPNTQTVPVDIIPTSSLSSSTRHRATSLALPSSIVMKSVTKHSASPISIFALRSTGDLSLKVTKTTTPSTLIVLLLSTSLLQTFLETRTKILWMKARQNIYMRMLSTIMNQNAHKTMNMKKKTFPNMFLCC